MGATHGLTKLTQNLKFLALLRRYEQLEKNSTGQVAIQIDSAAFLDKQNKESGCLLCCDL